MQDTFATATHQLNGLSVLRVVFHQEIQCISKSAPKMGMPTTPKTDVQAKYFLVQRSFQFNFVQFKMVFTLSGKPICAPPRLSQVLTSVAFVSIMFKELPVRLTHTVSLLICHSVQRLSDLRGLPTQTTALPNAESSACK